MGSDGEATSRGVQNKLLLSIPEQEFNLIRPLLEPLTFHPQLVLQEPAEPIRYAYFFDEGLASLVILTRDGRSVEVAIVGKEGMVGTPIAVGLKHGPWRSIVQIPGKGHRILADTFENALTEMPEMRLLVSRFVLVQGLQIAQIAACNRLHEIEQRLSRWLLMCQDRVGSEMLPVTHEILAQMLGTGRPSVSLAAGILQKAGLIENLRGKVRIADRPQLEVASCECYRSIQRFHSNGKR